MGRPQRKYLFAVNLAALVAIALAWFTWRVGAFSDWASEDISPEITFSEEQDELNSFALKSTPPATPAHQDVTRRRSSSDAPDSASKPDATAEPDAITETTSVNVDQGENGNRRDDDGKSPLQFAPLTATGAAAGFGAGSAGFGGIAASPGFGLGGAPLGSSTGGADSLADNGGPIPSETAHTAGSHLRSKGPVLLYTDEDFVAALSEGNPGGEGSPGGQGNPGGAAVSVAADSVLEATFAEEPSALPPPAPPLRANPEPASLLLLATGLGLVVRQLKRRTKTSRQA